MKKLFTIMSLVFLCSTLNVKAQNLFNQDFTYYNVLENYFNSKSTVVNQFDYISNHEDAPASVTAGVFSWNKNGNTSPAFLIKNTPFAGNPTFLKFQMRVRFLPPENLAATSSGSSFLCIGDGTNGTWTYKNANAGAVPRPVESFARVDFLYKVLPEGVSFRAGGSTTWFSGWQDITMFCNKTDYPVSYVGPDNVATTVNGFYSDLWIGTTKVRANIRPEVGPSAVDLKKFKIVFPAALQNMKIEIDYIKVWDESVLIDAKGKS